MALEGRDFNVVASMLHPGNVLTERRATSDRDQDQEPMMTVDELAAAAVTMASLPLHVNMLEAIVLPTAGVPRPRLTPEQRFLRHELHELLERSRKDASCNSWHV